MQRNRLKPRGAWYRVSFEIPSESMQLQVEQTIRGLVVLSGKRESYFTAAARRVMGVLIREFGI